MVWLLGGGWMVVWLHMSMKITKQLDGKRWLRSEVPSNCRFAVERVAFLLKPPPSKQPVPVDVRFC